MIRIMFKRCRVTRVSILFAVQKSLQRRRVMVQLGLIRKGTYATGHVYSLQLSHEVHFDTLISFRLITVTREGHGKHTQRHPRSLR